MRGINAVVLVGNLAKDPELRHTQGGMAVCNFRVAVNGTEKKGDEWVDRADFFDVTVWGAQAESCDQYLSRGKPAAISGRLRVEEWKDKDTGANRSKVVIVADNVQFLDSRGRDEGAQDDLPFQAPDDDIPF